MTRIEDYCDWLKNVKGIDLTEQYNEYQTLLLTSTITINDILVKMSRIYDIKYTDIIKVPKGKQRISNDVAIAKGNLVKYVLENRIKGFNTSNVYLKLFGYRKDHSTAIHHKYNEYAGEDLKKYKQLCEYLNKNIILWT